ncbi:MAG TPA: beta-N-acetylhexosaminidase, partial [Thauera sp.]|nr:beta-N-acetylhexosaminidase [Thauera sp.]
YGAGCDMLLVCNRPDLAAELLDRWAPVADADSLARLAAIGPGTTRPAWLVDPFALELHAPYVQARGLIASVPEDMSAAPAMTAATIGQQRTEVLRQDG